MAMKIPNGANETDSKLYAIAYRIIKGTPALHDMPSTVRKKWIEGFANGVNFSRSNGYYLENEVFNGEDKNTSKCSNDSLHKEG